MNVTYSNCYLGGLSAGDLLITDEVAVAQSLPATKSLIGDAGLDQDVAEAQNARLWRLAFEWFRDGSEDSTIVQGISAGDIAGTETAITILLPAARGVLEANAWLDLWQPTSLTTVLAEGGQGHYERVETVQAEAAVAAARQRIGDSFRWDRAVSGDPRNARLFAKYALTRDVDWLQPGARWQRLALTGVLRAINVIAALRVGRGHRTLVVHEYNPTRAFARRYAAWPAREYRLVRSILLRDEVWEVIRSGDRALIPFPYPASRIRRRGDRHRARVPPAHSERISARFTFGGVDLWPVLEPHLTKVIQRYRAFVARAAPAYRAQFQRLRPEALLVPFDAPPEARLLVRIAQQMDIPTFVMNDGFKSDSFELDCMTADHALAWSAAIAQHYLVRRTHGRIAVTGNPKADVQRQPTGRRADRGPVRRILVGGFAFSPVDLNCRRSDPERFLDQVLAGIEQSNVAGAEVIVKLHPADRAEQYADVLRARPNLAIELISEGDVVDWFARADVYVTGPSTSLLEALASGMPVIYYRVNQQHLHPPFSDDPFIERRTAASPQELAAALGAVGRFAPHEESQIAAWSDYYLGPRDGRSVTRILEAMQREIRNG